MVVGWLEAECGFECCLVKGLCRLQVLPMLDLVVEPCILCQVLDLSCKVLPWYVHDVGDGVFVFGGVVVLGMWVVCEVKVRVESYPYFV